MTSTDTNSEQTEKGGRGGGGKKRGGGYRVGTESLEPQLILFSELGLSRLQNFTAFTDSGTNHFQV